MKSYAWYSVTATQGHKNAERQKGIIKKEMTREQIAKSQELAAEYWEKYVMPFQED